MKKLISIVCVAVFLFPHGITSQGVNAEDIPLRPLSQREELEQLVDTYAEMYNVSAEKMKSVINCESGWNPTIQSLHIHNGRQEESFGLVQIHLPSHPSVTYEQATNPVFAIEFMARTYSEGREEIWTCYRKIYG